MTALRAQPEKPGAELHHTRTVTVTGTMREPANRPAHDVYDSAVDDVIRDDLDVGRYVAAIWTYRWLIVAAASAVAVVTAAATFLQPTVYRASATLAISESKLAQQETPVFPANFRPLIENRSLAAAVLQEFKLDGAPHFLTPEAFLAGSLSVEEVRNAQLLRLHVTLRDAALAAAVVNRVAALAIENAHRLRQSEIQQARGELETEVARARQEYEQAASQLEQFKNTAQVELTREDVKAMLEERGGLLDLLVDLEATRARVQRGETELAARQRVESLTKTIDSDPTLAQAAESAGGTSRTVLGLQLSSQEVNPVYAALEEQLAKDRAELAALESRRQQLIDVRKLNSQQQRQLSTLYRKEAELARLTTEYEVKERSYREIMTTYDVSRLQIASRSAQLQVVTGAIVPSLPQPRSVARNTLFAFLAGATIMVLLVLVARVLHDALEGARPKR